MQQGWEIRLLHETVVSLDTSHLRGDFAHVGPLLVRHVRDQLGDDVHDHDWPVQRSDVPQVPDNNWPNVPR